MQADNVQGLKRGLLKGIHESFELILVGDLGRGQEKRKKKRAFMQALKGAVLLNRSPESVDTEGLPAA